MEDEDFKELKKITQARIENLEKELGNLAIASTEIRDLVATALKKVANIDRRYENGDTEEKRVIVSSMFPENLVFDGTRHRTQRINSAAAYIYLKTSQLQGKKNGTNLSFLDLSQEVNPLVQNSNSLLQDLRRLNQLKDVVNQPDENHIETKESNVNQSGFKESMPKKKKNYRIK